MSVGVDPMSPEGPIPKKEIESHHEVPVMEIPEVEENSAKIQKILGDSFEVRESDPIMIFNKTDPMRPVAKIFKSPSPNNRDPERKERIILSLYSFANKEDVEAISKAVDEVLPGSSRTTHIN